MAGIGLGDGLWSEGIVDRGLKKEVKEMDKKMVSFVAGVLVLVFVFFAVANGLLSTPVAPPISAPNNDAPAGEPLVVYLSTDGAVYSPAVINARVGQPVRLISRNLVGCARAFVIPDFGIQKVFAENDDVLDFTPTRAGSFRFSCSMGMYTGTLNVA